MKEVPINTDSSMKIRLQDLTDQIKPRKLGYYKIIPSPSFTEKLPETQRNAQCYSPIKDFSKRELDTLDYAAGSIKTIKRTTPEFNGLIFDPQMDTWGNISQAMQLYATEYNMPVSTIFNGKVRTIEPNENTNEKQNVIMKKNEISR